MTKNTLTQVSKQSRFAAIPGEKIPRSKLPVDFRRLHSFNAGDVVPIAYLPMEPGDEYNLTFASLVRLFSPLQTPMMDNLYLDWFAFFGAKRLLWENFEKFYGAKDNPGDSTDYTIPYLVGIDSVAYNIGFGGVADGFSFPKGTVYDKQTKLTALLHRLYRRTWNEYFRDGVYQDSVDVFYGNGPDPFPLMDGLLKRGKRHDYFTSALDAPQSGPGVPIPWSNDGHAPVYGDSESSIQLTIGGSGGFTSDGVTQGVSIPALGYDNAAVPAGLTWNLNPQGSPSTVYADVSEVSATLNQLRTAIVLQQIAERDKRGGTRFTEILRNRWNVVTRDDRLQRIEYIGGGSTPIGAQNVVQTSETTENSPQGNLTSFMRGGHVGRIKYRAPEPGYIMVCVNVRARITYQQQLSRHLTRRTLFEFPDPLTMHLGEQPVYQYEMYYPKAGASEGYMQEVWGWQEAWAPDRYTPSTVTGIFASDHPQSLDNWHLALDYGDTPPVHDGDWIKDDPPIERVIQFPDQPEFIGDFAFDGHKISSMPVYSVPGLNRV